MDVSLPSRSKCQNVQPLHADLPCANAPTRWMEPCMPGERERAVGFDLGADAAAFVVERAAGGQHAEFDDGAEGDARFGALGADGFERIGFSGFDRGDAVAGGAGIIRVALDADPAAAEALCATAPVVPVPKKGSSTTSPTLVVASSTRPSRASGFCVGWALRPPSSFKRSGPAQIGNSQSERIWHVVVDGFQALVVEGDARFLIAAGPDQRFMRVGETLAAEVRHRVHFAPDDVVLNPEAEILQRCAKAEDIVIGADDPQRAIRLQDAAAFGEPGAA